MNNSNRKLAATMLSDTATGLRTLGLEAIARAYHAERTSRIFAQDRDPTDEEKQQIDSELASIMGAIRAVHDGQPPPMIVLVPPSPAAAAAPPAAPPLTGSAGSTS